MELIIDVNKHIEGEFFYIKLFKLHKSYLLMVSDKKDMGIGSVYLGIPSIIEGIKPSTANYGLFGMGRELLGKIISERCSSYLKSPVLLLLFLKTIKKDEVIIKPLMGVLNDIFQQLNDKKTN